MSCIKIKIPTGAGNVLNKLNERGYEAYVVGGCVRDSILGREPGDWDITTSAAPHIVSRIFERTYDTGIKHGTVTVISDEEAYEVTTYRIDGSYEDGRHPVDVSFTKDINLDLERRDFTMNAIAYHPKGGFVDPFNGKNDIERCIIQCVGNPNDRFTEDALRMLRAIRFSGQLHFKIEIETLAAITTQSRLIEKISKERIREELNKLLLSEEPSKLLLMEQTGLMNYILPEFKNCLETVQNNPYHVYNVGMHTIKTVESVKKSSVLRWTMLLHDIGKPHTKTTDEKGIDHFYGHGEKSVKLAEKVLRRLKFDNKSIDRILHLIKWHDRPIEPSKKSIRKAIRVLGEDIFSDWLEVKKADIAGQNPEYLQKRLEQLDEVSLMHKEIVEANECVSMKDLCVNGIDLITIGIPQGKQMGYIMNKLLDRVVDNPDLNQKEILLEIAKELVTKLK